MTKPVGIYIRVSTEDQAREGFSLENQEEACRLYVSQKWGKDFTVQIYRDVESGFSVTRKNYLRLLADCEKGSLSGVVVWRLDRLSRNTSAGLAALSSITESWGITVFSVQEQEIDFENPDNKLMNTLRLGMAEFERNRIKQRTMPGMKAGAKKGHYQGSRYPFWGLKYDKPFKEVSWVAEEVKKIKLLFEGVASGLSLHTMAKKFYALGYRNTKGKPYTITFLSDAIKREIYWDGYLRWNGIKSDERKLEPIIEQALWEKANSVVASNLFQPLTKKQGGPRRDDSPYILQGVLKCHSCGGNLIGHNGRGGVRYYNCSTRSSKTSAACKGHWIKAEPIEALALNILRQALSNPIITGLALEDSRQSALQRNPQLFSAIKIAERHIRTLETKHNALVNLYSEGRISIDRFTKDEQENEAQVLFAKKQIEELNATLAFQENKAAALSHIAEILTQFERVWNVLDNKAKKTLFCVVFESAIAESEGYRDEDKKFTSYTLRDPFAALAKGGKEWNRTEKSMGITKDITSYPMVAK